MPAVVNCGVYPVDEARRELVEISEEVHAESVRLAALTADQRARFRDRALRRLPVDLHADIREVFKRAECRADAGCRVHRDHRRAGGVRRRRTPAAAGTKATGSTSSDDEPPLEPIERAVRPAQVREIAASPLLTRHDHLTDAELTFLDYVAEAVVRVFFNEEGT